MIKNWKIDDVLDPDSNFWSTVHDEITIYLEAIGDSEPRAFYTFSKKIQDYLNSFKKQPSFSLDMFGIDMQEPRHTPDEINQADALISTIIWDLVSEEDKHNLFDDSVEYFNEFIDSCPNSLLDDFVRKLANGENLIPESRRKPKNIKEIIFNTSVSEQGCTIAMYNKNLIVSSINESIVLKVKLAFETAGNILREYRKDIKPSGISVHSYIFEIKNNRPN